MPARDVGDLVETEPVCPAIRNSNSVNGVPTGLRPRIRYLGHRKVQIRSGPLGLCRNLLDIRPKLTKFRFPIRPRVGHAVLAQPITASEVYSETKLNVARACASHRLHRSYLSKARWRCRVHTGLS